MLKTRVPIVDRNGKATHVWKMDGNGHHRVERSAESLSIQKTDKGFTKGMTEAMDNLWTQVQAAKNSVELMNGIDTVGNSEEKQPRADRGKHYKDARIDIINAAIGAGAYIEDLELELSAYEQMDAEERDADFDDDYRIGVTEIRFQKAELKKYLNEAAVLGGANVLNFRVTRTWEDGVAAVKDIYGDNPSVEQELPNGSTTFRYESTPGGIGSDRGWREITVNRLGNVTRFNSEEGKFSAASIDFPVVTPTGDIKLRGEGVNSITMHDAQVIAYVSTGLKDSLIP